MSVEEKKMIRPPLRGVKCSASKNRGPRPEMWRTLCHMWRRELGEEEWPLDVRVEVLIEVLLSHTREGLAAHHS